MEVKQKVQFVSILSAITIAMSSSLAGLVIMIGARQCSRIKAMWFCLAAITVAVWSAGIASFLLTSPTSEEALRRNFYIICISTVILLSLWLGSMVAVIARTIKTASKRSRKRLKAFLYGELTVGLFAATLGILLPMFYNFDFLAWAPVVVGIGFVGFYYQILRYRIIMLDAKWLRVLSYLIVIAVAAIIYIVAFYLIFTYIFKFQDLPASMLALNYIMIVIVLLLFPIINEVTNFVQSLIRQNQVDMTFILKRLNKMAVGDVDLSDLADFLAIHLHFKHIELVVNKHIYGPKKIVLTPSELAHIKNLGEPEYGIWQKLEGDTDEICKREGIVAVAELRDVSGKSFGQILVGEPTGKMGFKRKDLIQLEMIINLVAAMTESKLKQGK